MLPVTFYITWEDSESVFFFFTEYFVLNYSVQICLMMNKHIIPYGKITVILLQLKVYIIYSGLSLM